MSVVVRVNVGQAVDVVDAADVRRRHGAERGLQVVTVVQRGRAGPIREPGRPHASHGPHQVQLGDPGEGQRGEVTLKLVQGLFGAGRLTDLRQAVEVKLVGVALAVDLGHDVFVVIVS